MTKTWVEKRDCGKVPQVKILDKKFAGTPPGSKMLISSPGEIDAFIRAIPAQTCISPKEMRDQLADRHDADATCPASTGVFLRIVCEAALEERAQGRPLADITPFWRLDLENTSTAEKLSISKEELARIRQQDSKIHASNQAPGH